MPPVSVAGVVDVVAGAEVVAPASRSSSSSSEPPQPVPAASAAASRTAAGSVRARIGEA
jgi:hypothetical protein